MSKNYKAKKDSKQDFTLRAPGPGKNYNEKGDVTKQMILEQKTHEPFPGLVKVMEDTIPAFREIIGDFLKTNRKKGSCEYDDITIILTAVLYLMLGLAAISRINSTFLGKDAIRNLERFVGQELKQAPDYGTITDALSKIIDLDGFNHLFVAFTKALLDQEKFSKFLVKNTYAYWTRPLPGSAQLQLRVDPLLPAILDATELRREQIPMSNQDLTAKYREDPDDPNKVTRTDYYTRVLVVKVQICGGLLVTIYADFIENPEDYDGSADQQGEQFKQDCETNAGKRALEFLKKEFPEYRLLVQGDALYFTRPMIDKILDNGWAYLVTHKPGAQKGLQEQFDTQLEPQRVREAAGGEVDPRAITTFTYDGYEYRIEMVSDISRKNGDDREIPHLNIFYVEVKKSIVVKDTVQGLSTHAKKKARKEENQANPQEPLTQEQAEKEAVRQMREQIEDFQEEHLTVGKVITRKDGCGDITQTVEVIYRGQWATSIVLNPAGDEHVEELWLSTMVTEKGMKGMKQRGDQIAMMRNNLKRLVKQGRSRWMIENQGFNAQKKSVLQVEHIRTRNYRAYKAYFFCAQISDLFFQLYRLLDKESRLGCRTALEIANNLRDSLRYCNLRREEAYLNARACFQVHPLE